MTATLKNYATALKQADVELVMKAFAKMMGVKTRTDEDYLAAVEAGDRASIKFMLTTFEEPATLKAMARLAKSGLFEVETDAPARRGAPNGKTAKKVTKSRASKAESHEPREGSKLAQTVKMMSRKNGASLDALVEAGLTPSVWTLKNQGYDVQNIGERGAPVYKIG